MDVPAPLAAFQHARADRDGTKKLLESLNSHLQENNLAQEQLQTVFDRGWPELKDALDRIETVDVPEDIPHRSDRALLEEILDLLRGLKGSRIEGGLTSTAAAGTSQAVEQLREMMTSGVPMPMEFGLGALLPALANLLGAASEQMRVQTRKESQDLSRESEATEEQLSNDQANEQRDGNNNNEA